MSILKSRLRQGCGGFSSFSAPSAEKNRAISEPATARPHEVERQVKIRAGLSTS